VTLEAKAGDTVTLTAAHAGPATGVTWAWSKPAGSTAPASTTNVLSWTLAGTDYGTYTATVSKAGAPDTPQQGAIQVLTPPVVITCPIGTGSWNTNRTDMVWVAANAAQFGACTDFGSAWSGFPTAPTLSSSTFPFIDTSSGTTFEQCWGGIPNLVSVPALDLSKGQIVSGLFANCPSLTTLPTFNFNLTAMSFLNLCTNCPLTPQSTENILVSLDITARTGEMTNIGTCPRSTWTAPANAAFDSLIAKGWTVAHNSN
jgi:hypothetical protein